MALSAIYKKQLFNPNLLSLLINPFFIIRKNLYRVLRPNGKLLITVPFAWNEHEIPNDYGRYTSFGIRYLLEKNGFELISLKKSGHFAAVIAQLISLYIYELISTKNKYLNLLINTLFIFPLTMIGLFFSTILPRNKSLYFNNIVLTKKKAA